MGENGGIYVCETKNYPQPVEKGFEKGKVYPQRCGYIAVFGCILAENRQTGCGKLLS